MLLIVLLSLVIHIWDSKLSNWGLNTLDGYFVSYLWYYSKAAVLNVKYIIWYPSFS